MESWDEEEELSEVEPAKLTGWDAPLTVLSNWRREMVTGCTMNSGTFKLLNNC